MGKVIIMKEHSLNDVFAGIFRKQGFAVANCELLEILEFENEYMSGMIGFNKDQKRHFVRWKCKKGVELLDVPCAPGNTSCYFKKVSDFENE